MNYQSNQCPGCNGNRVMKQDTGALQTCPLCRGTGRYEPPYNRMPMTYVFGNASTITLQAGTQAGTPGLALAASLNIGGDWDFEMADLVAISNPGAAAGPWQDAIINTNNNYAWQPQGVFVQSSCRWGTVQRPNEFKPRIVIPRLGVLSGLFQDMSGATNILQACLLGYDLHPQILPAGVATP